MSGKEAARARVRQIAQESLERGDSTGWFERVYATAREEALGLTVPETILFRADHLIR